MNHAFVLHLPCKRQQISKAGLVLDSNFKTQGRAGLDLQALYAHASIQRWVKRL